MPRKAKVTKKMKLDPNSLICKPLNSYNEIMLFLENPPPWSSLCQELTPHSNTVIRNLDINKHYALHSLETPEHFCHFNPDMEEPKRYDPKSLRKTLVCHDMANGYHDDCIIDGTGNADAYTFYNWAGIDIFCYFSHHLITIPPLGWINVGHAHGVKVIGTIITEWAEGITFWDQVLASETEYQNIANILVAIAKTLKFDGYLLNIENKVSKPDMLVEFVRYFHKLLHEELQHAVLLWYDSVTVQGILSWQNKLNDKNKAFFDACDGFFTNYSWTVDDVTSSAEVAEERVTDLYIGVDVWGRNFYGGGQFNTQEAIKVAHAAGCSVALFAPGWTHEALSSDKSDSNSVAMADELSTYSQFLLRDRAFWGSVWPFLNTHVPCHLPFKTSFCRGQGNKRRMYGEVLSPTPWFNLRHQQYQPNAAHGPHCYLLTTAENIVKVTRTAQFKDKKGIMRYRSSFQMTRNELHHAVKDSKDSAARYDSSIDSLRDYDDDTTDGGFKSDDAITKGETQKVVRKIKMTDALKNLFKPKPAKTSDEEMGTSNKSGAAEEDNRPQELHEYVATSSGRSMQQMSVNLHLGVADKTRYCLAHVADERECLQLYWDDSFTGGACLKVNASDRLCPEHRFTRLFYCDFECADTLIFCVVTKTLRQYAEQTLNVTLAMRNAQEEELSVVLTGRDVALPGRLAGAAASGINYLYPLNTRDDHVLAALRNYLLLNQPDFYVPIDNCFGWLVRYYEMCVPGSRILSINVRTGLPQGSILLGHFGICPKT